MNRFDSESPLRGEVRHAPHPLFQVLETLLPRFDVDPQTVLEDDAFLRRLAERLVGDSSTGDDLAQDAWLAALRAEGTPKGPRRPWLAGTLRKLLANDRRQSRLRRLRESAAKPGPPGSAVDEFLMQQALRQRVVDVVVDLAEPYRTAVLLRFFEGLPPREIAKRLDLPVETARTQVKRGLDLLRSTLDREFGGRKNWNVAFAVAFLPTASTAGASLLQGAFVVSLKSKVALGSALVLLLLGAGVWFAFFDEDDASWNETNSSFSSSDGPNTEAARRNAAETAVEGAKAAAHNSEDLDSSTLSPLVAASPKFGRLEVDVIWELDGTPAANVPLRVLPFGAPDPFLHERWYESDNSGKFTLDRCYAGHGYLSCPFGGLVRIKVKGGETAKMQFKIPLGATIKGKVQGPEGRGIAGAEVYAGGMAGTFGGKPVTHSDASGNFHLKSISGESIFALGARAEGFEASPNVIIENSPGAKFELTLKLGPPASTLIVSVVDFEDQPVPDALVRVGNREFSQNRRPDGHLEMPSSRFAARSDSKGICRIYGAAAGKVAVHVRSPRFAPWAGEDEIPAQGLTHLKVHLPEPGQLEGRITLASGAPAPALLVQVGEYAAIDGHLTRTDKDGRYRIEGLAPGARKIEIKSDKFGDVHDTIEVIAGATTRFDTSLKPSGKNIEGIVVDSSSNAVANVSVSSQHFAKGRVQHYQDRTDANGKFTLQNLADGDYALQVLRGTTTLVQHRQMVKPGSAPIRIVVPSDRLLIGGIRGLIHDDQGRPVTTARIIANQIGGTNRGGAHHRSKGDAADFEIKDLIPGRYLLYIRSSVHGRRTFGPFEVSKDRIVDVGVLTLVAPAFLDISLRRGIGTADLRPKLWLTSPKNNGNLSVDLKDDPQRSQPLEPGPYHLRLRGTGVQDLSQDVIIIAGKVLSVSFDLETARPVQFSFLAAEGDAPEKVEIIVRNLVGEEIYRTLRKRWRDQDEVLVLKLQLKREVFVIEAKDPQGRSARVQVEADADDDVVMSLR
ncbi:MAG: sigma-70 family RNA polymerase sigma factor [Planctomycetota bacterium]